MKRRYNFGIALAILVMLAAAFIFPEKDEAVVTRSNKYEDLVNLFKEFRGTLHVAREVF